jgi:hypothetical protein
VDCRKEGVAVDVVLQLRSQTISRPVTEPAWAWTTRIVSA